MKTQIMQFRVTEQEKSMIEKCAKKMDMTVAEYIRACMLMEMAIDGEVEAFKIIGQSIGNKARLALQKAFGPLPGLKAKS
jgi:hypothetical protein